MEFAFFMPMWAIFILLYLSFGVLGVSLFNIISGKGLGLYGKERSLITCIWPLFLVFILFVAIMGLFERITSYKR